MGLLHRLRDALYTRLAWDSDATATGDLLVVVDDTVDVVHVGTDGYVLTADSGAPAGVSWQAGGGGGGGGDHATLTHLTWTASGHTGTASRIAAFDGAGAASYLAVGTDVQAYDADLAAIAGLSSTGLVVRTGAGAATTRTLGVGSSSADYLTIADGDGVAGAPTFTIDHSALVLRGWVDPSFGDASDGDVTLSSNTTLVRDMQYDTLDMAGFNIDCDGYRLRCRRLENSGGACTISNNGDSAVNRVAGAGPQAHSLGNGTAGGNGGTSGAAGTNGVARSASWGATVSGGNTSDGGAGGASGAGQAGGNKGDATAVNFTSGTPSYGGAYWMDMTWSTTAVNAVNGGAGGGGGGASAAGGSAGGGGGAGGGVVSVHAHTVAASASNITIQANAGNAGNVAGTNAGGGGGGGGGYIKFIYQVAEGTLPTVQALKGTGTAAVGTGVAGADGNDGLAHSINLGT